MRIPLAAVLATGLAAAASAQPAAPPQPLPPIVIAMPEGQAPARLTVTSQALSGGVVPLDNTQYGANHSIDLAWTRGPAKTRSYVVIAEDSDVARDGVPINHWLAYNVPAGTTALPPRLPLGAEVPTIRGMRQLMTAATNGMQGYRGPRAPAGQTHTYHFQVFALDTILPPIEGAGRVPLVAAMKGHVLAAGEAVARFTGPATAAGH